jgi:hypothetical protein
MDRVKELAADYRRLGTLLKRETDGTKAAALARERRILGELLESLEAPSEVSVVDQLAARRAKSKAARPTSGRRKSG